MKHESHFSIKNRMNDSLPVRIDQADEYAGYQILDLVNHSCSGQRREREREVPTSTYPRTATTTGEEATASSDGD